MLQIWTIVHEKFGIASSKLALLNADIIIKTAKEHGVDLKDPEDFVNYLYPGEILQLP